METGSNKKLLAGVVLGAVATIGLNVAHENLSEKEKEVAIENLKAIERSSADAEIIAQATRREREKMGQSRLCDMQPGDRGYTLPWAVMREAGIGYLRLDYPFCREVAGTCDYAITWDGTSYLTDGERLAIDTRFPCKN